MINDRPRLEKRGVSAEPAHSHESELKIHCFFSFFLFNRGWLISSVRTRKIKGLRGTHSRSSSDSFLSGRDMQWGAGWGHVCPSVRGTEHFIPVRPLQAPFFFNPRAHDRVEFFVLMFYRDGRRFVTLRDLCGERDWNIFFIYLYGLEQKFNYINYLWDSWDEVEREREQSRV